MINRAPKVKAFLGRAIVDGRVRFLATTTLEKADPQSGGCLRRWHYRYVGMRQEPKSKAQEAGTAMHADIARYYTTGEMRLGPLAATGAHLMLPPGPDLLIEHAIELVMQISDRIVVLSNGEKIADGTPKEVRSNQTVLEAYLGHG